MAPDQLVDGIESTVVAGTDEMLRDHSVVAPPTVHMLAEDLEQPFVGSVFCRPFYRGSDAAAAVAELGMLPSAMAMTRLVVVWEWQDLQVGLEVPVGADDTGLVVLDATLTGETVRWHPLRLRPQDGRDWDAGVVVHWGDPVRVDTPVLPAPITSLLETWRSWRAADLHETAVRLQAAGHRIRWVER